MNRHSSPIPSAASPSAASPSMSNPCSSPLFEPLPPLIVSTGGRNRPPCKPCDDAVADADCDVVVFPDTLNDMDGALASRLSMAVAALETAMAARAAARAASSAAPASTPPHRAAFYVDTEWVPAGNDMVPRWILPVRIVVCPRRLLASLERLCPLQLLLPPTSTRQFIYDPRAALAKKGFAPGKLYTVAVGARAL